MTTILDILTGGRTIIAVRRQWTQHEGARDASDQRVHPQDGAACAWCAHGALMRASGLPAHHPLVTEVRRLLDEACMALFGATAAEVNDGPRVDGVSPRVQVLAGYDRAIARARAEMAEAA
ncbi:hypothetical protein VQ02_33520 [Methylobacterium variabile]|uniref:Uncharacterized protein n=1 Tax=Methylobacterium variabile TaxID=298794 RepID=A0A0J6RWP3_9HYPH|nr:hypothetical protein [Methylobacterium variabile]KMO27270.1 hypothetical protein VQ02_33520 [Methylobacterium variabile]